MKFQTKNPHYEHLRKKWIGKHKAATEKFLEKHGDTIRKVTLGGLGGLMLLNTPGMPVGMGNHQFTDGSGVTSAQDKNVLLAQDLKDQIPGEVRKLTLQEETKISDTLSQKLG